MLKYVTNYLFFFITLSTSPSVIAFDLDFFGGFSRFKGPIRIGISLSTRLELGTKYTQLTA